MMQKSKKLYYQYSVQTFFRLPTIVFDVNLLKKYGFILGMEGNILSNTKKITFISSSLNINNANFMMSFQFNILLVLFASSSFLYNFYFYIHFFIVRYPFSLFFIELYNIRIYILCIYNKKNISCIQGNVNVQSIQVQNRYYSISVTM